jgi:CBS domain containing-hemolysin-like protein
MATLVLLRILVVVLLVALNAFFVAAEFAIVSVRDTRIQQLIDAHRTGARTVQRLQQHLDDFLPAVQFGVTLASLALGWIGEPVIAQLLLRPLAGLPHALVYAHTAAVVIAFITITYFHVIMGELVPKSLALQRVEQVAVSVAGPMDVFITITRPLLHLMTSSANAVLKLFGSRLMREGGMHSPEELKLILSSSRRLGLLPPVQEEIMHRALDVESLTVREILVPRQNIFSLPSDMTLEDAMARVVEDQHSRIPVYDPKLGREHIVGVLYAKDLARFMHLRLSGRARSLPPDMMLRIRHIMRDVLVVPETKPVLDLLAEFRERKRHLAIVVDEYGSTVGLVTVEDALEQIVGEIEDEFDVAVQPRLLDTGGLILEGGANVRDLESHLHIRLPRDEGFETLGGFIMWRLGRLPRTGDTVRFEGRSYSVLEMEDRRVLQVKVETLNPQPKLEEQASLFNEP